MLLANRRQAVPVARDHLGRSVSRSVIDHHQLIRRAGLTQGTVDGLSEIARTVIDGDDHRDAGGVIHVLPRRRSRDSFTASSWPTAAESISVLVLPPCHRYSSVTTSSVTRPTPRSRARTKNSR